MEIVDLELLVVALHLEHGQPELGMPGTPVLQETQELELLPETPATQDQMLQQQGLPITLL
jgi:hypothetical protein